MIALLERTLAAEPGEEIRNPAAFLTWLARNRTIDRFRAQAREVSDPMDEPMAHSGLDDDEIARLSTAIRVPMRSRRRCVARSKTTIR